VHCDEEAITAEAEDFPEETRPEDTWPEDTWNEALLDALLKELAQLRKAVLRQGHAQELFQARVEEAVGRWSGAAAGAGARAPALAALPNSAQVRSLVELDQALLELLRLATPATPAKSEAGETAEEDTAPRSLREGLSLLQVRVRNLQHSLGLEAIPTHNQFFDDRWHEARGVAHRPDLPDGWVVEELLPGYRLGGRVVRPARVVVNRREEPHA
jgi:GrpE protein